MSHNFYCSPNPPDQKTTYWKAQCCSASFRRRHTKVLAEHVIRNDKVPDLLLCQSQDSVTRSMETFYGAGMAAEENHPRKQSNQHSNSSLDYQFSEGSRRYLHGIDIIHQRTDYCKRDTSRHQQKNAKKTDKCWVIHLSGEQFPC